MLDSVRTGLAELEPMDLRDRAAAHLALAYAAAIDTGKHTLTEAGPKLLATLTALQMTPVARAAVARPPSNPTTTSPLDELRAKRAARTA